MPLLPGVFLRSLYPTECFAAQCFLLQPRRKEQAGSPCYECAAVRKNRLSMYMESMCLEASISNKMNQSLRVTGATALFNAGVPESIFRDVTGHWSNALSYMRILLSNR